jgi:sugar phosphate isomerase/epimerase
LCDQAKNAGTNVVLEILPWSNIPDIATGIEVVSGADKSNGGLLVDIWHMARGGIPYDEVASLPRRFLGQVELSDAAPKAIGPLIEDTVNHRRLCGEGSFDVPSFLRSIKATGYAGPFGRDIISDEQRNRPLKEAAERPPRPRWHSLPESIPRMQRRCSSISAATNHAISSFRA